MNNEETRLINEEAEQTEQPQKNKKSGTVTAAAVGGTIGAMAGSGMTAAASVIADKIDPFNNEAEQNPSTENKNEAEQKPASESENLLLNNGNIRVAHVDDNSSFAEAFAEARNQVGPGGVFEWHGKLYGTYTADEWNAMTPEQRAEYQQAVFRTNAQSDSHNTPTHREEQHPETEPDSNPENPNNDHEIKVISVEQLQENGEVMNVALTEIDGEQRLLVDVDNDGTIDVLIHDDNHNDIIEENEIYDISSANISVDDLHQMQAAQNGDLLYANDDGMPDYIDDADTTFFA